MTEQRTHAAQIEAQGNDNANGLAAVRRVVATRDALAEEYAILRGTETGTPDAKEREAARAGADDMRRDHPTMRERFDLIDQSAEKARAMMKAGEIDGERLQISPKAAAAINQLATILPAVDREPSEADVTRHMMTGEEPRSWTLDDLKRDRADSGEKAAGQQAAAMRDASAARRDSQRRDYDLER